MSLSRSLNSIYSFSSDSDSSFPCNPRSYTNNRNETEPETQSNNDASLSVSRPLFFTFTMGSGSSGAYSSGVNTAESSIGSMSGSEAFSVASTPVDTPPVTPSKELGVAESVLGVKGSEVGGLSARREMEMRIPLDGLESFKSQLASSFHPLLDATPQNGECSSNDKEAGADSELSPGRIQLGKSLEIQDLSLRMAAAQVKEAGLLGEEEVSTPLAMRSSPRRARRPPPLNLSLLSSHSPRFRVQEREAASGNLHQENMAPLPGSPYPIGPGHNIATSPYGLGIKQPKTAPLIPVSRSPVDLPPAPHTAPLLSMPKKPTIRPSMPELARSPSPLTLPSPGLPWSLDRNTSSSRSALTPWSLDELSSPPLSTPSRVGSILSTHRRKTSLGYQMTSLHISSGLPPVPPSLKNSPFLISPTSPFGFREEKNSSNWNGHGSKTFSPKLGSVGTPLKLHMNPYFSQVTLPDDGGAMSPVFLDTKE